MNKPTLPYRRSIWDIDIRYHVEHSSLSKADSETINRLSSVDAAKKQVPPIPGMCFLKISQSAKAMPEAE